MRYRKSIWLIAVFFSTISICTAESESTLIKLRVMGFNTNEELHLPALKELLQPNANSGEPTDFNRKSQHIKLPLRRFSRVYEYSGGEKFSAYRPRITIEGKLAYEHIGDAVLPQDKDELLLIFSENEDGQYTIIPIPEDKSTWPQGSIMMVNFLSVPSAVHILGNDKIIQMKPGEHRAFITSEEGKHGLHLTLAVDMESQILDAGWKLAARRSVRVFPNTRLLLIITPAKDEQGAIVFGKATWHSIYESLRE